MNPTRILLIGFAALLVSCAKQEEAARENPAADSSPAGRYFAQAENFFKEAKYDSAIVYLEKARAGYEAAGNWEGVVHADNKIGENQAEMGAYEQALELLNKTLALGRSKFGEQHRLVAATYHHLGYTNWRQGKLDEALAHHKKALALRLAVLGERHAEVAQSYHFLGEVYQTQGDLERAIAFHELGLSIRKATLGERDAAVAESYNTMAGDHWFKGDYDKALDYCHKALAIWRHTVGEQHPKTANTYGNLAILYATKGDHVPALEFFGKELAIRLAILGEQHPRVANTYGNIGLTHELLGEYDQALVYTEKAIAGMTARMGEKHPILANNYNNKGKILHRLGHDDQAMAAHNKALSILLPAVGEKHPAVAQAYNHLGEAHIGKRNYAAALTSFDKSASVMQALYGKHHPELAQVYNNMGKTRLELRQYDLALQDFQRAVGANIPTLLDDDLYADPPLLNVLSENDLLLSLDGKARAFVARHAHQSQDPRDLKAGVAAYQYASRLIDKMRSGYKAEGSKLFLSQNAQDIYDRAIQSTRRLLDPAEQETAFLFAEKSKAGIILEALTEAEAKQYAGIPDSLLAKEHQLRVDLAFYDRNLTEAQMNPKSADSAKTAQWRDQEFQLKQDYEALLERFEREYPDYYNLKYRLNTVTVAQVRNEILGENTALVEYFTGKDSLFIFTITANAFGVTAAAKDASFERAIQELRQGIVEQNFRKYTQAAHQLYQTLLAPLKAGDKLAATNLIIIPDAALSTVPFEALLAHPVAAAGGLKDFANLPLVLNDHAVSYAYSATLLQQTLKRKGATASRDYLAFAPVFAEGLPAGTRGGDFLKEVFVHDSSQTATASAPATVHATRLRGYLPVSKMEVTNVFGEFNARYNFFERWLGRKSQIYLEREAKEEKLKSPALRDYRYLHFATHGLVNEKNPKLSGLVLTREDSSSTEDGILHLGEIYNLNLNADLVVLSACETGLGQVAKGEGIIGLTRGFLYAGASNLLVSLWQVSDVTTADLMVDFYDKMLGGMSKPEALREAKLQMIHRHPEYAKPYYWAPFILVGR
jgi:CHAT domain-containing protein